MRWRSEGNSRPNAPLNEESDESLESLNEANSLESLPSLHDDDDDDEEEEHSSPDRSTEHAREHSSRLGSAAASSLLPTSESHDTTDAEEEESSSDTKPFSPSFNLPSDVSTKLSSPAGAKKDRRLMARRSKGPAKNKLKIAAKKVDDTGSDQASPPATSWMPQNEESTCEFTHTITDYAQKRESGCKKAEYSDTTVDSFGNRWRLIIYVNGNGRASNHHLSLFLQVADADDLPFGWKKAVSYVLTLEHPKGSGLDYAKRNPDKMFKLCPKAIDWGWSQFITSDRIQQEGFIENDSLTVHAAVTVKSSSVTIDKDDAELYLKYAVEEGNAGAVETCLEQGANVNCKFKDDLYTPLHTACSSSTTTGSLDVLDLLLKRGADGNACNKWRETPLLIAANNGHTTAVKALLKSGADPSLCSEAGWSALTFAAHKGYDDIVMLLLKARAPVNCCVTEDLSTPLHKACAGSKTGHLLAVKQLLDAKSDVHALNKWRETPLLTAANHGHAKAVEALLKSGADPCMCTDTGWSPLSIAAYKGHDDVVRLLLDEGAPTEEADPTLSALLQAATKGLPDTVELLLAHGADHTVTTKKGDTALSILVEQNLIDAAVEMVMEYKASIARCSRDRKKVQRARLMINLRIKQQQRDGVLSLSSDEDETDNDSDGSPKAALHDDALSSAASTPTSFKKKKKKEKSSKESAEAQARAAEEALLMELEQEETQAQKEEAAANSKRAKNKKKKERQRQQKLKEEQEQREREEKEAKEKELVRKIQEEKERKERLQREKEKREREREESAERENVAAAKRKEREAMEKRRREQEKKERDKVRHVENGRTTPADVFSSEKRGKAAKAKGSKKQVQPSPDPTNNDELSQAGSSTSTSSKATAPSVSSRPGGVSKNRGWEAMSPVASSGLSQQQNKEVVSLGDAVSTTTPRSLEIGSTKQRNWSASPEFNGYDHVSRTTPASAQSSGSSSMHGDFDASDRHGMLRQGNEKISFPSQEPASPSRSYSLTAMELPGISMYRQEKLSEIFERCALARSQPQSSDPLSVVDESTVKTVTYRWIVRAAHGSAPFLDSIIPSWTDFQLLSTFFQRQFIAESRKGGPGLVGMEALKEAGNTLAMLCHNHAESLVQTNKKLQEQLPHDWTDSMLSLSVSEVSQNGMGTMVVIDWANRAQIYLPTLIFAKLRDRYVGPSGRVLTAIFGAKKRYDLLEMVVRGTAMDYHLSPATKSRIEKEVGLSAEISSDPFSTMSSNLFYGYFPDVDALFGGLPPFAGEGRSGEETAFLRRGGCSIAVLPPFDNMLASRYVRRMIDVAQTGDKENVPISFVAVLPCMCFRDVNRSPELDDLLQLDPRLNEAPGAFVRFVEVLAPGQHTFHVGVGDGQSEVSRSGSLFVVIQNETARRHNSLNEVSLMSIVRSMGVNVPPPGELPVVPPISFSNSFPMATATVTRSPILYRESIGSQSPLPQPQIVSTGYQEVIGGHPSPLAQPPTISTGFGAIGGTSLAGPSSGDSRRGARRGRLFELIDDGDDENLSDADVVSGMLSNLNVDLFQNNPPQDVDIEAISLMGIGNTLGNKPPISRLAPRGSHRATSRFA